MPMLLYTIGAICIILGLPCVLVPPFWLAALGLILASVLWLALGRIVDCLERLAFPERYAKPVTDPEPSQRMTVRPVR